MPRGGRSIESGRVYHIISRFVAKEWFIKSELERNCYVSLLGGAMAQTDWRLLSYAIMSSHLHFGLVAGDDPLVEWMRPLHTRFARWMNEQRERIGAVFVRGPNVIEIRSDGVGRMIDYIHRNPERAGVVRNANDSNWTSQRAYAGLGHQPAWLDVASGLELVGMSRSEFAVWLENARTDVTQLDRVRAHPKPRPGQPKKQKPLGLPRVLFVAGVGFEPTTFGL